MPAYNQDLDSATRDFYVSSLKIINDSGIPYLVGGAYALAEYAGLTRHTRDLDLFTREEDCQKILDLLAGHGYRTEMTFTHWLGKAFFADEYIDVIFGSGNGIVPVDDVWFEKSRAASVFGVDVRICPAEEIIWSKSFIMERERFDGADIAHIIRSQGENLDWDRLLRRFGQLWRPLLAHLILFGFIYPEERYKVPARVLNILMDKARNEATVPADSGNLCQGTLLSREQYLVDLDLWHYNDARLTPLGNMDKKQIAQWTAAIATK